MKRIGLITLVCLALGTIVFAGEPMMMKPDPMLRQLDWFAGKWDCSGTAFATPTTPEHPTKGSVDAKWGLGGYWIPFTYTEMKTAQNAMPITVSGFFGYDAAEKKLVLGGVDSMGGYSTESSDGWNGDSIAFTGPWHMASGVMTSRDTFMKKSANELMHMLEADMNGTWTKLAQETCWRKK